MKDNTNKKEISITEVLEAELEHETELMQDIENKKEEWEERFDDQFDGGCFGSCQAQSNNNIKDIKDFIFTERQKVKEETIKEVIEEIEKIYGKFGTMNGSLGYQGMIMGIDKIQTPEDVNRDLLIKTLKDKRSKK